MISLMVDIDITSNLINKWLLSMKVNSLTIDIHKEMTGLT